MTAFENFDSKVHRAHSTVFDESSSDVYVSVGIWMGAFGLTVPEKGQTLMVSDWSGLDAWVGD